MAVKPIPDGYHSVTPMFVVDGAGRLIDFLNQAFGAAERLRMPMPDGSVAHAELTLGDSVVMVADATPEWPAQGCSVHLYVEDVDATYNRALQAGATSTMEPEDRFYGDRAAAVRDPFGNSWSLATHIEDVPEDEMMRRMAALGQT
jgi:PhnB protein